MNAQGQSLLHLAASHGSVDCCSLIMKHSSFSNLSLHKQDPHGNTPLHLAAQHNHASICQLLMRAGSDVFITNEENKRASQCSTCPSIIDYLTSIETSTRSKKLFAAMEDGDEDLALQLVKEGIQLDAVDEYSCTPLIVACINDLVSVAKQLLQMGTSVDVLDDNYQTPLHWSAMKGNTECIQLLCMYHHLFSLLTTILLFFF